MHRPARRLYDLPDLSVMLREELLKLPSIDPVVFSYCEPYKIGKLNVSVFMFEHVALGGEQTTSVGSGNKYYDN